MKLLSVEVSGNIPPETVDEGVDGGGEFADDGGQHVHVRGHVPRVARHRGQEHHSVRRPRGQPQQDQQERAPPQLLLVLDTWIIIYSALNIFEDPYYLNEFKFHVVNNHDHPLH